jgi:transposase
MRRSSVEGFVKGLGRCIVAMEACCGAHHLGRVFAAQGHETRLISPEYVRPYVKAQKNDELDAEAIAEAATRPTRLNRTSRPCIGRVNAWCRSERR